MYGSRLQPASLPIPLSLQASHTATAPNVSYPQSKHSALFALAGGPTTNFGLRFTGEPFRRAMAVAVLDTG